MGYCNFNKLELNENQNKPIMKLLFVLFETDVYKSKSSRIFLGVFSSFELANQYAKENNCYTDKTEVVILEVILDQFKEM